MADIQRIDRIDPGVLRFLTAGSVDDGKSTLIGRLLHDSKAILTDQLASIERTSRQRGTDLDLSLLTDGLVAEREQGITIDVAYRYFATPRRKFIIADAPGHEQYTRNMITAASTAQLAVLLVDARHGVVAQTKRHAMLAHLLGVANVVVAVNKMDVVGYRQDVYAEIEASFARFAADAGITAIRRALPVAALHGDMIVERGSHLGWYDGPTLLDILESAQVPGAPAAAPFRFPVQFVARLGGAGRGYMGRVESGVVRVGDAVSVLPSGRTTSIRDIHVAGGRRTVARRHENVTLFVDDAIDVARGDMLVRCDQPASTSKRVEATLSWLGAEPLNVARSYRLRHTTREIRARIRRIDTRWNVMTHVADPGPATLAMNDIGHVAIELAEPMVADAYADNRATGRFILVDEATNGTVAAGMIARVGAAAPAGDSADAVAH
jgi:sulfate adenylyltransferase subunit 1